MSNRFIYVVTAGNYDQSRWLQISLDGTGDCVLHLQDLCHPGMISHLSEVTIPIGFFVSALDHGPLQISTGAGYLLLRRSAESTTLEFFGEDDQTLTKVAIKTADIHGRITALQEAADLAKV